ncbi:rho guanine nucleotide exchange factor 7 isoform X9 [Exaiptasia diaphana]|nr:rho guanine nucleotide exchange factor 7 isoform X9 [Exaiptasia diaphana]
MTDYGGGGVRLVKATFPFQGTDDDEICFVKGDILEVTKVVDGGWWEGTINGKYGWFPSNYVKEISSSPEVPVTPTTPSPDALSANKRDSARVYHNLVVQNILDTERAHVSELQALLQNYLKPLQCSNVLSQRDLKVLCGNFEELVKFQQNLFSILDECAHQPLSTQRMAANFLQIAPQMKELYLTYCANHPRAVEILTRHSDDLSAFIESKGAPAPGILTLTTSLSKPFRHLDKYPTLLLELERHLEDGHMDKLDTKKAIAVFQNIKTSCNEMRKKKETELEILTGDIEGLDKEELSKCGDVILVSQFLIHGSEGEVKERYFLLFPSCLLVLHVSAKLDGFCFEKKYDLTRVAVRLLEDTEGILNAFEIRANGEVMKVSTNHAGEKTAWMETMSDVLGQEFHQATPKHSPKTFDKLWDTRVNGKVEKPSESSGSPPGTGLQKRSNSASVTMSQPSTEIIRSMSTSHSAATDMTSLNSVSHTPSISKRWDFSKLRPTPPLRPAYALMAKEHDSSMGRSVKGLLHSNKKKQDYTVLQCLPLHHGCLTVNPISTFKTCTSQCTCRSKSEPVDDERHYSTSSSGSHLLEEDMLILRVIESYCTSARARHTLNSSPIAPEVPAHTPRAMSTSSLRSDWKRKSKKKQNREDLIPLTEPTKTRPDSEASIGIKLRTKESKKSRRSREGLDYNCLKKTVEHLQYETMSLRESLAEEQMARRKMEKFIRSSLKGIVPDLKWEEFKDEM